MYTSNFKARKVNMRSKYEHLKDEFIKEYKDGKSIRQIALKYGVAKGTVSNTLKKYIELRPKSVIDTFSEQELRKIYEMYMQGIYISHIADNYNVSAWKIKKTLKLYFGVDVETNRRYENLVPFILKDYADGLSLKEIGVKYGISPQCVLSYINLEGEKARDYSESVHYGKLDTTYFDNVSSESANTLGVLYATASLYTFNTSRFIHINAKVNQLDNMLMVINRFASKSKDQYSNVDKSTSKVMRVCSLELSEKLKEIGLGSKLPTKSYLKGYVKEFLDGFFMFAVSVKGDTVRICCSNRYKEDLKSYFDNRGIVYRKSWDFAIGNTASIIKIIKCHPVIKQNIIDYINIEKDESKKAKWYKILKEVDALQ